MTQFSYFNRLLNKQKQRFADVLQNRFLKNFSIITGKHLCWSLFLIKLQIWRSAALLKRDSNIGVRVNIGKFLRTAFFIKHLWWLLLNENKSRLFILLPDWLHYVIKSIKTLNSKQCKTIIIQKQKLCKETETRKTKTQKDENLVLPKE